MKGKINLHTKGTLKSIIKRHFCSYKALKISITIWKKLNFLSDVPNFSDRYQLSLTYFAYFEVNFVKFP